MTGQGITGGGVTSGHIIDDTKHKEKFLQKVRRKSERRASIPRQHLSTPYIVALQNDEFDLRPITVLSALTGTRVWLGRFASGSTQLPPRIDAATCAGWSELLSEWNYIDSASMRLADYGAFGKEEDNWASSLSGVLVTHSGGAIVQWLPNPFAAEQIREPQLLRMGLPLCRLGGPIPSVRRS